MKFKYFLDHSQIKRNKSFGNGNTPGSLAERINFGGNNKKQAAPAKPATPAAPKPQASSGSSKSGGFLSNLFKK